MMLFPYILSEKYIYILALAGNGQPRESALCQLYRRTFIPYWYGFSSYVSLHVFDCASSSGF